MFIYKFIPEIRTLFQKYAKKKKKILVKTIYSAGRVKINEARGRVQEKHLLGCATFHKL